jgi:hypothetical protein
VLALDPELELAGMSPVSLPTSKVVTMTARMGQGFLRVGVREEEHAKTTANAEDAEDAEVRGGGRDTEGVGAHGGAPEGDMKGGVF